MMTAWRKPTIAWRLTGALVLISLLTWSQLDLSRSQAAPEVRHPHLRAAILELKAAKQELKEGAKIFGGHRVKSIKAIDVAIEELQAALDFADK